MVFSKSIIQLLPIMVLVMVFEVDVGVALVEPAVKEDVLIIGITTEVLIVTSVTKHGHDAANFYYQFNRSSKWLWRCIIWFWWLQWWLT